MISFSLSGPIKSIVSFLNMDARRRRERASVHHVSAATTASTTARSVDSMNVTVKALSVRNEDTGVKHRRC